VTAKNRKLCRRDNTPGDAHYLTFSCYRRLPLLKSPWVCSRLLEAIAAARDRHEFDLWAYVLMPEHVHLVLFPRNADYSIARILTAIKRPVAYEAIRRLKERKHPMLRELGVEDATRARYRFWQAGGGYDRNLTTVKGVHAAVEYVHSNPVRRGLTSSPTEWPWSSARDWHGAGHGEVQVDKTLPTLMG